MSQLKGNQIEIMENKAENSSTTGSQPLARYASSSTRTIQKISSPGLYDESIYSRCGNWFILKRRNLQQFRILLCIVICINIFAIIAEIVDITVGKNDNTLKLPNEYAVLSIIAAILAFTNVVLLSYLILRPSSTIALMSCALILFLEIIYITQVIIFYVESSSNISILAINIIFIILQFLTSPILYRYWEYIFYYYDDTTNISLPSGMSSSLNSVCDIEAAISSGGETMKLRKTLVE